MESARVDPDTLPVDRGFRLRGLEMTRLETFVDAAFAFATTLLVVSVGEIPRNYAELALALKKAPSFLAGFALIMTIWAGHRKWSRRFGLEDRVTTLLSLTLVFVMLVYVFPLRLMVSAALSWVSGGFLPSEFELRSGTELPGLFVIYGLGTFAISGLLALLHVRARNAPGLRLDAVERTLTSQEVVRWSTMAITGLASALFAWLTPPRVAVWSGFFYTTLCVSMPVLSVTYERRAEKVRRSADGRTAEDVGDDEPGA